MDLVNRGLMSVKMAAFLLLVVLLLFHIHLPWIGQSGPLYSSSIMVAAVATDQTGGEGRILRFVFLHSLVLAALVGLLTLAQAYAFPWMMPAAN